MSCNEFKGFAKTSMELQCGMNGAARAARELKEIAMGLTGEEGKDWGKGRECGNLIAMTSKGL